MLCGAQYGRHDRLFTRLPVYLSTCSPRRLVYVSAGLLVYLFTCLRIHASSRLRVRGFTRLPVHLSTCFRVDSSTGPRVYSFSDLLVYLFPRRLVYGPRVYSSTGSLVYSFPPSTASQLSAHGREDLRQLLDHAGPFEALADHGQNGVVARDRAAQAFGFVRVDFGRDARGIARPVRITTRLPENSMLRKPDERRNCGVWIEGAS